jgi:hypothetical protein
MVSVAALVTDSCASTYPSLTPDLLGIPPLYAIRNTQYATYFPASFITFAALMALGPPPNKDLSNSADRPRRANGSTQTFRRPSHAPTLSGSTTQSTSRDASGSLTSASANPGVYVPPHAQSGRNGSSAEGRYSRDQLLQLYHAQRESEDIRDGMSSLYVGGWEPNVSNGTSNATWGRRDDPSREAQSGVDLCWDRDGSTLPLSLSDMTEEEREVCQFRDKKFLPRLIFSSLRPSPRQLIPL